MKDRDSYKAMLGSTVLGSVTYSDKTQSLTLINHSTALHRKVLLLGYSKKASHHDVIGQFEMEQYSMCLPGRVASWEVCYWTAA